MFIPMAIANMPAGNVTIDLGIKGESISVITACASSTNAIGEAYRAIKLGYRRCNTCRRNRSINLRNRNSRL